jgi:hypothetical protein
MKLCALNSTLSRWRRVVGLVVALVLVAAPAAALAAEPRAGNDVVVGRTEIINDDLYVGGGTVTIDGAIFGDLVVAGGTVTVNGPVRGNVIVAAGTTTIRGPVDRSVRAVGGTVTLLNRVTQDVVVAGGNVIVGPGVYVGRDVLAGVGSAVIQGTIERNVTVGAGELTLDGTVRGDVTFQGTTLRLADGTSIGGNLSYANNAQLIGPVTGVKGQVRTVAPAFATNQPTPTARLIDGAISWARAVVALFVLGLMLVLLFPAFSRQSTATLRGSPAASFATGLSAFIIAPIVAFLIFAIGLVVGGWWLGLIALVLYSIALAVGLTVAGLFIGGWLAELSGRSGMHPVWVLLLGMATLELVGLIPIVGGIAVFVALLFGLGALLLAGYHAYHEPRGRAVSAETSGNGPSLLAA